MEQERGRFFDRGERQLREGVINRESIGGNCKFEV